MAYSIPFTDEANKGSIIVEDGTLNEQTSIKFPGRNYTGYGNAISENFLRLLENFANNQEPARAIEGQLWYDSTPGREQLKVYDGTSWRPAGNVNKAASEPDVANTQRGDLWVDTDSQQLYLNSGSGWILVGPDFSDGLATGSSPETVIGTDNREYSIIIFEVQAQPVAIMATEEFTPKTSISGFSTLRPGVNLSNRNITGAGAPRFLGTSEKSENLIVNSETVPAANFLRGDIDSTSEFPLNVRNNIGIRIGTDAALNLGVEGQAGIIQHQIEGSNIDVRIRSGGSARTVLRVDSSLRLGVNNEAPDEALDVVGNIQTDSSLFVNGTEQSDAINAGSIVAKGGVGIAKNLNVGGNSRFANLATFANVIPDGNTTRNLGTAETKWQTVHATTFVGNLTGNVSGTVSGVAGSAEKLASATTFQLTGDVSSPALLFDGQQGGSTKLFQTSISNAFIGNREEITATNVDDEILVNRVSGATGLFKVSRRTLLDSVPVNPPGVILPYAGESAPPGWLLCDGSEYRRSEFNALFTAIGYAFGARPTVEDGFFRVPDFRGRMPLGADNMGGTAANTVEAGYADGVGQVGGSDKVSVAVENLPEHEHDLKGDSGDQYYAIRDVAGTPNDIEAITYDAPTGLGNGQAYPNSGGLIAPDGSGEPLDVMNPTVTVNYIIYTGRSV
jgi:microcystin-dependent protein